MTMREFIKENRAELENAINGALNFVPRTASCSCHRCGTDHYHDGGKKLTASEIRDWVANDEVLYHWARRSGVRV